MGQLTTRPGWIGFSARRSQMNRRRCSNQAAKPQFCQRVEDNAFHLKADKPSWSGEADVDWRIWFLCIHDYGLGRLHVYELVFDFLHRF